MLELARLQLVRDACVDLRRVRRRLAVERMLAAQLELAEALQLQDLEHEHEVDAGRDGARARTPRSRGSSPTLKLPWSSE